MTGQILDFSPRTRSGVILGDDGQRYGFVDLDWIDSVNPIRGMGVDFEVRGDNAVSIYRALRDSGGGFSSALLSDEKTRPWPGFWRSSSAGLGSISFTSGCVDRPRFRPSRA